MGRGHLRPGRRKFKVTQLDRGVYAASAMRTGGNLVSDGNIYSIYSLQRDILGSLEPSLFLHSYGRQKTMQTIQPEFPWTVIV